MGDKARVELDARVRFMPMAGQEPIVPCFPFAMNPGIALYKVFRIFQMDLKGGTQRSRQEVARLVGKSFGDEMIQRLRTQITLMS